MKSSYLRALNMASFFVANKVIVFIAISAYVLSGNKMSASAVFMAVALYGAVRLTITLFFPSAIEKTLDSPTLQDVSFAVRPGELLAVIGPVGAGKVKGRVTYASQQPWIFPGTIRSNILFGKVLQPQKYERVLRACALKKDMALLPDGDLAVIGDRGANLSGGQKARINLASREWSEADRDTTEPPERPCGEGERPLGGAGEEEEEETPKAVLEESRSAGTIGLRLYLRYLTAGANVLRLLALIPLNLLAHGRLDARQRLHLHLHAADPQPPPHSPLPPTPHLDLDLDLYLGVYAGLTVASVAVGFVRSLLFFNVLVRSAQTLHRSMFSALLRTPVRFYDLNPIAEPSSASDGHRRIRSAEVPVTKRIPVSSSEKSAGVVVSWCRGRILNRFSKDIGHLDSLLPWTFVDFVQVSLTSPGSLRCCCGDDGRILNRFSKDIGHLDSLLPWTFVDFVQVPFAAAVATTVAWVDGGKAISCLAGPAFVAPGYRLATTATGYRRRYHHARSGYRPERPVFQVTAAGRNAPPPPHPAHHPRLGAPGAYQVTQRKDAAAAAAAAVVVVAVGSGLTQGPYDSIVFLQVLGVIAVAAVVIPWILIPVAPLFAAFLFLRRYFLCTSRDVKRLESTKAWFLFLTTSRWFAVRLDGICSLFVAITAFGCLYLRDGNMTSVERVVEYTELESEGPWETSTQPPPDWPAYGTITLDRVNFSYGPDGPLVLQNLNVASPHERRF
ncbi:hypothetical protein CRUP_018414 [Coryphaenoides rupestris]|nr:hypothetical protein CRUP_018414 [Coryphaenoides rupestris]